MVKEWPDPGGARVLVPQSEIAEPTLVSGLRDRGIDARFVSAYRTVGVAAPAEIVTEIAEGRINGLLVSSGSVARQIAEQHNLAVREPRQQRSVGLRVRSIVVGADCGASLPRPLDRRPGWDQRGA